MSEIAGPVKPLVLNLPEPKRDPAAPRLSHNPLVDKVTDFHKWIVSALASGFTAKEVASMFDCSEGYVHQINNWRHPVLAEVKKKAKDKMMANVESLSDRIALHAEEALNVTVGIMNGTVPNVECSASDRRLAAKDILDRAGYAPVKKTADVTVPVPSQEFVDAVHRMTAVTTVDEGREKWAWRQPIAVVPAPEEGK